KCPMGKMNSGKKYWNYFPAQYGFILHLPPQGGIWKAVGASTDMGGCSFSLFLASQSSWKNTAPELSAAAQFREECAQQEDEKCATQCSRPEPENFHPGSSLGCITTQHYLENITQAINHALPGCVWTLAGQGSTVDGVCLDTCYDLSAEGGVKSMLEEFDQTVGLDYLRTGISAFRDIVNELTLDNLPLILVTSGW
uniref:Uncharacterized protein n=1 Tax=Oncorhynchus kisutch TaxID=8019 RepID=A0A8C7FFG5_ONCKI